MNRLAALLLSLALIVLSAAPASAAPPEQRLEGTLQTIISEIPGVDGSQREYVALELDNGTVLELQVSARAKLPPAGSRVEVRGRQVGETFAATEGGVETLEIAAEQTTTPSASTKKVAVLMVNFVGDTRTPWTPAQVATNFFADAPAKSIRSYFAELSYGGMAVTGDVFGYYTISADRSSCKWSTWHKLARDAAAAAGVNLSGYSNVMAVWPGQSVCGWAGIAYLPGIYSALNNTISWSTASHELGHNLGAHHAQSLSCTDAAGARVPLSNTCTTSEYGDQYDRMGSGSVHFNHYHRRQLGFLGSADQQTATASGSYTIGVASHTSSAGPKIVRVARGDGTFVYLETRRTFGLFESFSSGSNVTLGVTIRIGPDTARTQTKLVDTTPATTSFSDAALVVGRSFTDPASKVTVTTTAVTASGSTVTIAWPGQSPSATPAPSPSPSASVPTPTPKPTASPTSSPAPTAPPVRPTVLASTPADGATGVAYRVTPQVTFSEPVMGVSGTSMLLVDTRTGRKVAGAVTYHGAIRTATFIPLSALRHDRTYRLSLTNAIRNATGTALQAWQMRFTVAGVAIARHAGDDRYATAAALSAASFAPGVPVVYVSTGATFPDALAAGPAATKLGGPVLLVATNRIPSATAIELRRLRPGRIIVAGGPAVVSSTVLSGLRSYAGSVSRQAGSDRFSTAAAVSAATFGPGVPVLYVATGLNFPDALAGGPASGMHGGPVLLVETHSIPAATARELQRLKPGRIVVAGGASVVSNAVLAALRAYATTVSRQSGGDRYATAVAISVANHKAGAAGVVYIATARTFPDALAAAPVAGRDRGPVLLVSPTSLPASVAAELKRLSPNRVVIVGGASTVSDSVVRAIRTAIGS
jgi:putative cell wall-binding protein